MIGISISFGKPRKKDKEKENKPVLKGNKQRDRDNEEDIDPENVHRIILPEIERANPEHRRKSQEYWQNYNQAEYLYNSKRYNKAKPILLRIPEIDEPHDAYYTLILRTYRKILNSLVKRRMFKDAHAEYLEFFRVCKSNITSTDRRKFNKIVKELQTRDPSGHYSEVELEDDKQTQAYDISFIGESYYVSLEKEEPPLKSRAKSPKPRFVSYLQKGKIEVYSYYNSELLKYDRSRVSFIRQADSQELQRELGHGIFRFKASWNTDRFVILSDDLNLILYSINSGEISRMNIGDFSQDKYHTRCVDISPDGNYFMFTSIDRASLLDSSWNVIKSWRAPPKQYWERRTETSSKETSEAQEHLLNLGLENNPSKEEIEKAFREMIIRYHPDRNPDDQEAVVKTRELIESYEYLTGENALKALSGIRNMEYYYKEMKKIRINIPGTDEFIEGSMGMFGPGEDWIYSTCIGPSANRIYLGCYSGRVYRIDKGVGVTTEYSCHGVTRDIYVRGELLIISNGYCLYLLKNDKYVDHVITDKDYQVVWDNGRLMVITSREVSLFTDNGVRISTIKFRDHIQDAVWKGNTIEVRTGKKDFSFCYDT